MITQEQVIERLNTMLVKRVPLGDIRIADVLEVEQSELDKALGSNGRVIASFVRSDLKDDAQWNREYSISGVERQVENFCSTLSCHGVVCEASVSRYPYKSEADHLCIQVIIIEREEERKGFVWELAASEWKVAFNANPIGCHEVVVVKDNDVLLVVEAYRNPDFAEVSCIEAWNAIKPVNEELVAAHKLVDSALKYAGAQLRVTQREVESLTREVNSSKRSMQNARETMMQAMKNHREYEMRLRHVSAVVPMIALEAFESLAESIINIGMISQVKECELDGSKIIVYFHDFGMNMNGGCECDEDDECRCEPDWGHLRIRGMVMTIDTENESVTFESDEHYCHPHVSQRDPCFGSASEMIDEAAALTDWESLTHIVCGWLLHYNGDSPYNSWDNFNHYDGNGGFFLEDK